MTLIQTDVQPEVTYGRVTGYFVSYLADSADAGTIPDEIPLTGTVLLTPLTSVTRWPTTVPPRLAIGKQATCPVVNGYLCTPGSTTHDVWLVATDQPEGQPDVIQWKASFRFDGVTVQPADVVFNVPAGGSVDLALIATVPPAPGTIVIVSHEDALAAEAAAEDAEADAAAAAASAAAAAASAADAAGSAGGEAAARAEAAAAAAEVDAAAAGVDATDAAASADAAEQSAAEAASAVAASAPKTAIYLKGTATGNEAAAIQAVLDAAGPDEIVRLYGTFSTASTITITKNVDASGAVINYSGSGIAVQVGATATATLRKTIVLPRIICTTKPATGWVAGTIGLKITNAYSFAITVPHVQGFEVGMLVYGENNQGTSYASIYLGHLDNNKINHKLSATVTGWSNENKVFGGRMSHNTAEGIPCVGTKHVLIEHPTGNADPNNNLWVGTALESPGVVEWTIDAVGGSSNRWINCRYEFTAGNPKVRWGATATRNLIDYGVQAETIAETHVAGSSRNNLATSTARRMYGSGEVSTVFENDFTSVSPAFSIMEAGSIASGAAPATAYAGRFTAQGWQGKRAADPFDRVKIDPVNSRVYLGSGAAAPVAFLSGTPSAMVVNGVGLFSGTDATYDIGAAASLRFRDAYLSRYVRAGTAVVTGSGATASRPAAVIAGAGAMFLDTTLGKPIWSDGTNWKDATGATV